MLEHSLACVCILPQAILRGGPPKVVPSRFEILATLMIMKNQRGKNTLDGCWRECCFPNSNRRRYLSNKPIKIKQFFQNSKAIY